MIPSWANSQVYAHFDAFLEKCIIGNDSYITDNPGIFTIDNLNACVVAFVDNPDEGDRNFDEKSKDQFEGYSDQVREVFAHLIWLWGLPASDMRSWGKKGAVTRFLEDEYNNRLADVFVDGGIGSAGQRHKLKKPFEISYLLLLFRELKSKQLSDVSSIKKHLESLCRELYYKNDDTTFTTDEKLKKAGKGFRAMHHILLHLCDPQKYEAIAAQKDKNAIINTFYSLLDKENTEGLWDDQDDTILQIREKLSEIYGEPIDSFYDGAEIERAWNFGESKEDISIDVLFEYKKALIFYGPPGTSKTYSATRLAELIITKQFFRNRKNIKDYFENADKIFEGHIHNLQLHSNYNYEDFIAGLHIDQNKTDVKQGYLLDLIDKIKGDPLPHILILDEINRTDISRLFGELFSALEYRNKPIQLSVGSLKISLPDNLYFIGTMNEIDFSLERIDFALRRRFLWQFMPFDRDILWKMINKNREDLKIAINDNDVEKFVIRCEQLNEKITKFPELGENYQIGHTFFAEIVEIYKTFKGVHSGRIYFIKQPVKILWEVSIKPIIQAFMGNLDSETRDNNIKDLEKIMMND